MGKISAVYRQTDTLAEDIDLLMDWDTKSDDLGPIYFGTCTCTYDIHNLFRPLANLW